MDLIKALRNNRIIKALSGLDVKSFYALAEGFQKTVEKTFRSERRVDIKLGRRWKLRTGAEMLFFILFYMKCYPTFDLAGVFFNISASEACRWVHWLMPALTKHLGKELVLPERRIGTIEEFFRLYPRIRTVFIDGTERQINRPGSYERQKEYYSGKKKRHMVKNIVINDDKKRVLVVTETVEGKKHDKSALDESELLKALPDKTTVVVDLGFQGIAKENERLTTVIPAKKPKKKELTEKQKRKNKKIARKRVVSEHTISGIKRYGAVSRIYRNHKAYFEDAVMLAACGLWNFYLKVA